MADHRDLTAIISTFRDRATETERRAKRRIVLTGVLCVFVASYMTWMHTQVAKLDADAVMDIARGQIEAKLPELGDELTTMAIDAAPGLMDQGEEAVMRVPSTLRDTVETRLAARADGLISDMEKRLGDGLAEALDPHVATLATSGENGQPIALEDLMLSLRQQYRDNAGTLVAELYIGYAKEIGGVNDYLVHLRDSKELNEREGIHKEIIHASVALRHHYIEPVEATDSVGMTPESSAD
jgi:hypothetical protein